MESEVLRINLAQLFAVVQVSDTTGDAMKYKKLAT
jgi:hypothetical protein